MVGITHPCKLQIRNSSSTSSGSLHLAIRKSHIIASYMRTCTATDSRLGTASAQGSAMRSTGRRSGRRRVRVSRSSSRARDTQRDIEPQGCRGPLHAARRRTATPRVGLVLRHCVSIRSTPTDRKPPRGMPLPDRGARRRDRRARRARRRRARGARDDRRDERVRCARRDGLRGRPKHDDICTE